MSYLVAKSLHLIGITAWFAGLFYIFRLYVYHVENQYKPELTRVFEVMERRLYYAIMMPAMIFTLSMGIWLIKLNPPVLLAPWFHGKLLFLALLFGYHFFAGHVRSKFARGEFFLSSRQCRFINEVPTLILISVVFLAVCKSF